MSVFTDVANKSGAKGISEQVTPRHGTTIDLPAQGTVEVPGLPEAPRRSIETVDTVRGPPLQAPHYGGKGRMAETQQRVEDDLASPPSQPFGNPLFREGAQYSRQAAGGVKIQKHGTATMHDRGYEIFPAGLRKAGSSTFQVDLSTAPAGLPIR